ncbi:MAG TPA: TIM-barrel domain-containing protein [Candidatus Eisenbacteria bacterium]|nr:TIM-barrel domain-containing protein [Candidatus Eisenbacteria bacterium]
MRLRVFLRPAALLVASLLLATVAFAQWTPPNPVTSIDKLSDGILVHQKVGTLKLQVCSPAIVHLTYSPTDTFSEQPNPVILKTSWPPSNWKLDDSADSVGLSTSNVKVAVDRKTGAITYSDASGKVLLHDDSKTMTPVTVNGEKTYRSEDYMTLGGYGSSEAIYGLGQHQAGVWNYRGESIDLSQDNTGIAVPLMVSSAGYGLFWNNTSRSRFNNRFEHALYVSSEVADSIDYYFLYGPQFDRVIAGYRELTGAAPMFGKWAYGFWQCKNRYKSQSELLGVAQKYRELQIPVDNIVQDWFWWNRKGEHAFNANYPDPKGMIDQLHSEHFHFMISVWPFFEPGSTVYETMDKNGWFIDKTVVAKPPYHKAHMAVYDASNPAARKYYWQLMNDGLFKLGIDAWWLDTTEPETEGREENIQLNHKLAIGSGNRYVNLFPLMTTTAVYEGQRAATDQKRVFILSRSAFAGSQRNAVAAWSGDINSDWITFKRQIPAGLNFELSGLPYWTTDIGGFVSGNPDDPAYRELFIRWFQFGTFSPIFRVHGTRNNDQNELWSYGPEAQKILTTYDRLRYRLMPYIYSMAWMVTNSSYTPMRALAMDFLSDSRALNAGDQFMYGPALLVSPVTEPGADTRRMYLPKATWYDFWTGRTQAGGATITTAAPLDRIPLFVRAGSILPMGPELQYAAEKPADPIELRVYRGADGSFTLYEDENDGYAYEKGVYATIPIVWNEASQTLTIGERKGKFPGMLDSRAFRIVFVKEDHGAGTDATEHVDRTVTYSGQSLSVQP